MEPRVVSESLNESCNDSVVGIGTFCHRERCDSQRHTMEMFKPTLGSVPVERPTDLSLIEKLGMARAGCPCCLQYYSVFSADKYYGNTING